MIGLKGTDGRTNEGKDWSWNYTNMLGQLKGEGDEEAKGELRVDTLGHTHARTHARAYTHAQGERRRCKW